MKVVVLAGGLSPERDVSLSSGSLIANALINQGYEVMLLDLFLGVNNTDIPAVYKKDNSDNPFSYNVSACEPDLEKIRKKSGNGNVLIGSGVIEICSAADVVFMALHGSIGENGQLQALFDIYNINYTGSGYIGSMLAMDKDLSKKVIRYNNILTADWWSVSLKDDDFDFSNIEYPCVVKPCSCGSSVGISLVDNKKQLEEAILCAKKYEDDIIIERRIFGREFSVGVFDGKTLPEIEIIPKHGFYDYANKYQANATLEVCPAEIDDDLKNKLSDIALKVHKSLKLGFYSRIDFIVDDDKNVYFLEANTLPGMTPTSLLPQEARVVGISYDDLCSKIVLDKYKK